MPPLIGIIPAVRENSEIYLPFSYQNAIERSGGESLILPLTKSVSAIARSIDICSGFLFIGGPDPDPRLYGEDRHPLCHTVKMRDDNDTVYFNSILESGKPIIGICRGIQMINLLLGGSLYCDVKESIGGAILHSDGEKATSHPLKITEGSPLERLFSRDQITVNSQHHQGVRRLGRGLAPMAYAPDGLIEAVYHRSHPYLRAYQWHPERSVATDEYSPAIFRDFLSACEGDLHN